MRFLLVFAFFGLLITACTQAPKAPLAVATDDSIVNAAIGDTVQLVLPSDIHWIGTKISGYHHGSISFSSGYFVVKADSLVGGRFVIDMASITDADLKGDLKGKLETHLKSADFFDVAKHPTASFDLVAATPAKTTDSTNYTLTGNLTLRGVAKQISFPAQVKVSGGSVRAKANFNINRKDWGVAYEGKRDDLIRDEINLDLDLRSLTPAPTQSDGTHK
jgi:polyisoprenoid-binding protein YceI